MIALILMITVMAISTHAMVNLINSLIWRIIEAVSKIWSSSFLLQLSSCSDYEQAFTDMI